MLDPAPDSVALEIVGQLADGPDTIILLGPKEPEFWPAFSSSEEFADGAPDPLDRYSKRIVGELAQDWGGKAVFPSDGPPYPPFITWALESGEIWSSPVGLMVHHRQGL